MIPFSNKNIKQILLVAFCAGNYVLSAQETTTFREDFFEGIPENVITIDNDGNEFSPDVKGYGFNTGDSWIPYFIEAENNMVAASTSWYKTPGTSDDYMVLPTINKVPTDGCVLKWRARSSDKWLPNQYKILAITKSLTAIPTVADFKDAEVIYESKGETTEWANHNLDLSSYAGKSLTVAFVDCSRDCALLYVDDITFGPPAQIGLQLSTPNIVTDNQPVTVKGVLFTDFPTAFSGNITLTYLFGEKNGKIELGDVKINPDEWKPFEFHEPLISLHAGQKETLKITATVDGKEMAQATSLISAYNNVAVCEELTGTWCAWCVKGIAVFEHLTAKYPGKFLPIAIHNADVMATKEITPYHDNIYSFGHATGYPFAFNMRDKSLTTEDWDSFDGIVEQVNAKPLTAMLNTLATKEADNNFALTTSLTLAQNCDGDRFRPFYVLIEDDVFDPEDPESYVQHNAYAGGGQGKCGGYEELPEKISDVHYQHVARATVGDFNGQPECFPRHMRAGKSYTYHSSIVIPSTVLNVENCSVATLLIDNLTSTIAQATITPLGHNSAIKPVIVNTRSLPERWYNLSGVLVDSNALVPGIYIHVDAQGKTSKVKI